MRRRQHQQYSLRFGLRSRVLNTFNWRRLWRKISRNRLNLVILLIIIGLAPPFFFHFRLTHFQQIQMKNCGWLASPPLVCAHGGDSINAFPNTVAAYRSALRARVDCIEIDVSRSADGFLFALHDRDLQRISGNHTARVGFWSKKAIKELDASLHFPGVSDEQKVPTVEDALTLVSNTVRVVILDAKVGPPFYEKGLAEDILAVVKKINCFNCVIWAKSDHLVREITRLSPETTVGYIIMKDPVTGYRSNVLRMKRAKVVGVYHPLIDEKLVQILHGRSKKIFAWTVDDTVSMLDMLSNNVDGVVTSNPALFQQLMDDTRVRCLEDGFSVPR
ncbi:glycerophosphodiester phosphodiesterase GDPD4 [Silene latifolia]|uniref:glycerophosphodiester phosphodiesterase GDPD4 n=1 Tax=Silene latifolia TaxID=37657 RepID=UPI003D77F156